MKFKELYFKKLDRTVNPAVSASDIDDKTVRIEIEEYVFTNEIINNLYTVLSNIRQNRGSHTGIWISGYYGSGKSHFLKYVNYCLSPVHGTVALGRLRDAVAERQALELEVEPGELDDLIRWFTQKAKVDSVMFNIGTVYNANSDKKSVFTEAFWNEFNGMRGFNENHLALAQFLEKALNDDGQYDSFLQYVKEQGYDWKHDASRFNSYRLDLALEMAQHVDPKLSIDVIRERIKSNDVNISVEAFAHELKEYVDGQNDKNYRMVFFVDEISQFIDGREGVLLQLQEVVTRVCEACHSQVWFACTAQQDLSEVIQSCNIASTSENFGKIMGRFEVRTSLQGTNPEYITQKRILDKTGEAEIVLGKMYEQKKNMLDAQFVLPTTYQAYRSKEDFIGYYPFVPYQFPLIMKVLDSFVNMNYVDKQVKGNERSLINITFSIAKETANMEVGEFISFDRFFGAMFRGSMQHLGQRALENARHALELLPDGDKKEFHRRVVFVLFMICNLSDVDKQTFSATIDNVVTLLMTKVDANKAAIKSEVATVLAFLIDKAVIRKTKTESGTEIYEFYTEEESQVAQLISNQKVDANTYSEELYKMTYNHFGFNAQSNKEAYATRSFNVGADIDGLARLSNNADVYVDFKTTANCDSPEQYALNNPANHLVFFLSAFNADKELRSNFLYYCRVQRFAQEPVVSEERQRTKRLFQERARDLYQKEIQPQFQQILDTCPVISGSNVLPASVAGVAKRQERYKKLLAYHLGALYHSAKMVDTSEIPKNTSDLLAKILRPVDGTLNNMPLTTPETRMQEYLERSAHDITVANAIQHFAAVPYGWSEIATIYVLNELVRRHLYAFNYNNNPEVSREEVARNIVREPNRFTIEKARAISQELLNRFIESWKQIFNVMTVTGSNDSTELYRNCKEKEDSALNDLLHKYYELSRKIGSYPFADDINTAIELLKKWSDIREPQVFFQTIIDAREEASLLFDRCKKVDTFVADQFDKYRQVRTFVDNNRNNFDFLSEQQDSVEQLRAIQSDKEPWEHIPAYLKMMRTLGTQLDERKKAMVGIITEKHNAMFDELEKYADSVKVPHTAFDRRESVITRKTTSDNFYMLKDNADTSAFYEEQMRKINAAIPPTDTGEAPKQRKIVKLHTHSTQPMRTEADIDRYLQSLKEQLMPYIDGNNDIIVS
ncbi:MAG: BREX system P-loop protein BrxC [Mediterranea sp.]|jgi:hypothetical protein|nr:BREX system P-loop protein BrxC [Mediterranea sp.]